MIEQSLLRNPIPSRRERGRSCWDKGACNIYDSRWRIGVWDNDLVELSSTRSHGSIGEDMETVVMVQMVEIRSDHFHRSDRMNRGHKSPIVTILKFNRFVRTLNSCVSATGMHLHRDQPCSERAYRPLSLRPRRTITLPGNDKRTRQLRRTRSMTLVPKRVIAYSR